MTVQNDRKSTVSRGAGSKTRLMDFLGLSGNDLLEPQQPRKAEVNRA